MPVSAALRACWHPVAYSHALTDAPRGVTLLDEPIALWRSADGTPRALHDLCIHRGTALSLGTARGDEIVCPYHGWRFGADGVCTFIPQLEDPCRVPKKGCVPAYACMVRYGLIWVALAPPRVPLPEIPELESPAWKVVHTGPFAWRCDASRQVENFTDFGHFPFVHPGLLGDTERTVVPEHAVHREGLVLHYSIIRPEAPNSDDFPIFANQETITPERRSRYALHLPYTIVLRLGWGEEKGMVYFFVSQPVAEDQCIGYCLVARNYDFEQPDGVIQGFEETIFEQDRRVVESQRPDQVPFDLAEELHLKFDAVAVAYRRAMKAAGMAE